MTVCELQLGKVKEQKMSNWIQGHPHSLHLRHVLLSLSLCSLTCKMRFMMPKLDAVFF